MKRINENIKVMAAVMVAIAVLLILIMIRESRKKTNQNISKIETSSVMQDTSRMDITFVLGEDAPDGNQYYTEAINFYQYNEEHRAEILVTTCRSLQEMRDYLEENAPVNKQPWGTINVVVHSNEWQGMSVAVIPEGPRSSAPIIKLASDSGLLKPLPNAILDSKSEIMIYGCGLGKDTETLKAVSLAFGGHDTERPLVRSSKYFVYYNSKKHNGMPYDCKRYFAEYWYTDYPSYHYPGDYIIAKRLKKQHPDGEVNWNKALERKHPRFSGDEFHTEFKVPLVWYVTYEDGEDRPELTSSEEEIAWVKEQEDLVSAAADLGFEVDDFRWYIRKATYEYEDGLKEPAMKAIGFCSIVCVLKPFVSEEKDAEGQYLPLEPEITDSRFYGASQREASLVLLSR